MVLVWYWYSIGMVLDWHWYGVLWFRLYGMVRGIAYYWYRIGIVLA